MDFEVSPPIFEFPFDVDGNEVEPSDPRYIYRLSEIEVLEDERDKITNTLAMILYHNGYRMSYDDDEDYRPRRRRY